MIIPNHRKVARRLRAEAREGGAGRVRRRNSPGAPIAWRAGDWVARPPETAEAIGRQLEAARRAVERLQRQLDDARRRGR